MDSIWQGLLQAIILLVNGDAEVYGITWLTIKISGVATVVSVLFGVPAGLWLALKTFPGKRILLSLINFGMGLPPVVVGLFVSLLLWRYGPLGLLGLMYTPLAMIMAQAVSVLTTATVMEVSKGNFDTAIALSFVLLIVTYGVVAALTYCQQKDKGEGT